MLIDIEPRRREAQRAKAQAIHNQRLASIAKRYPLLFDNPTALALMLMAKGWQDAVEEGMG